MTKAVLPFLISNAVPRKYPDTNLIILLHYSSYKVQEIPVTMQASSKKSMHTGLLNNILYICRMISAIIITVVREKH